MYTITSCCGGCSALGFQWDEQKNVTNARKHGVSLAVAEHFDWDSASYRDDLDHEGEDRYVAYGYASDGFAYSIVYTYREEDRRIISVRRLTKRERTKYLRSPL